MLHGVPATLKNTRPRTTTAPRVRVRGERRAPSQSATAIHDLRVASRPLAPLTKAANELRLEVGASVEIFLKASALFFVPPT
jgi:hypothetical protein